MQNYKKIHVIVKDQIASIGRHIFQMLGRYESIGRKNLEVRQTYTLDLKGDMPPQRRCVYKIQPPEQEMCGGLMYTPQGIAIKKGKIIERFSIRRPSLLELVKLPNLKDFGEVPTGTILQSQTPYTYGDWVGDFLHSIATAQSIVEPIILPNYLADKSYVKRDLEKIGINYIVCRTPIKINTAYILRKKLPSYYWNRQDVKKFREKFSIEPPEVNRGSITYLARFDTCGEAVYRHYPSSEIAKYVLSLGGHVCDTRYATPEDYEKISSNVETVIADQGSAIFNVVRWNSKHVIELTNRNWWHNSSLFFSKSSGVVNYSVISIDKLNYKDIEEKIEHFLANHSTC
ncbi:MAG: hypothetical protein ABJF50_25000 [Paracoccaceae bacterium]